MEAARQRYERFLALHAHKAHPTYVPTAHIMFAPADADAGASFVVFKRDDLDAAMDDGILDRTSEMVRWLTRQFDTYSCTSERLVCLVLQPDLVLSDVLRMPRALRPTSD